MNVGAVEAFEPDPRPRPKIWFRAIISAIGREAQSHAQSQRPIFVSS